VTLVLWFEGSKRARANADTKIPRGIKLEMDGKHNKYAKPGHQRIFCVKSQDGLAPLLLHTKNIAHGRSAPQREPTKAPDSATSWHARAVLTGVFRPSA